MKEQRQQAYLQLIQNLLSSSSKDEIQEILAANQYLLDAGFLQTVEASAQMFSRQGDENKANFLEALASYFRNFLFLMQVLQKTESSQGDPQVIYPLLAKNTDKINEVSIEILREWGVNVLRDAQINQAKYLAEVIQLFSSIVSRFPLGNTVSNIEIAITGFKVVLTVYTQQAFPYEWAGTQNNLANAYLCRIKGEQEDNLELAIACYQEALKVHTFEAFFYDWARTQNNLAMAYFYRIKGKRADNLEQSLVYSQEALKVFTFEAFPYDWAGTQNNLATAYIERIRGEKADNLEQSLVCFQNALKVRTFEAFPYDWARTQNNLANAYIQRIKGEKADNLEQSLVCSQEALKVNTLDTFPVDWAGTQNNLANAYIERIEGEKADNLESAITCSQNALKVYTFEDFPYVWAKVKNNLANAYIYRIRGERAENLELAIACLQEALKVQTLETFPVDWATTQNSLATAYLDRIIGDKAENLEQALACFQQALKLYTFEDFPNKWARTQNNLGEFYSDRIKGNKAENLELALAFYRNALKVYTFEAFPYEWAMMQNNIATAYIKRIRGEQAENLELAIDCFKEALKVRTFDAFPVDWSATQNNLGAAYTERIKGERAENLELAIACLQEALKVRTFEAFPIEWSSAQNNLALAYTERIKGERAKNLELAIASCNASLAVRTHEALPQNHAETLFILGKVYQNANQPNLAYTSFASAITTTESLREEIVSGEESKRKQAEKWNELYSNMIEVCLELGNITEAIEYVERSKTRNLVEQILERDSKTIFPANIVTQLKKYRDEIATGQYKIQNGKAENPKALAQHLQHLRQQRNKLQNHYLPVGYGFKSDSFQYILDERTAIIEWYVLKDKILVFVITYKGELNVWQSQTENRKALGNWGSQYLRNYDNKKEEWQNSLGGELKELASILHIDEIFAQIPNHCNKLVLIPHHFLHLLPLHALPISQNYENSPCLMDLFTGGVSYAPSCQILQQIQKRERPDFQSLFAIQNPTEDLYQDYGKDLGAVSAIKKQFTDNYVLKEANAKKAEILHHDENTKLFTLNEKLAQAHNIFFFCHGFFNISSSFDSGLQLADENITLADIIAHFKLKNCRLVTLAACETGVIDFNLSDEYIGLPYGFLLAGSTNVVSSLWTVSATATALLMIKFYEELRTQNSITVALNITQRWLRDTTAQGFQDWLKNSSLSLAWRRELDKYFAQNYSATIKPFESPFYWSAFFVTGKGV
ncbi:CHAT domain-containing tetratricopeptide repeat protein [Rivularia sp. UHCC 0363]|uniref:CHAT domain-containing tetratricopeptide repeat protein n=1 Tax=Rivularia sp. UHCC 0363 TaxID=3110244 RepID=UPI002B205C4D|nr:CHAT domain-containing protein [Rivularia sp. UHCC 0363]MEA5594764.1 CHAT domain-containing protein [Rivularia sp. UHCC 0363]